MKPTSLLVVWLLFGSPSFAENPSGFVKQIVPGVWFRQGSTMDGTGVSNNAIIEMKDYLIVVDANYPMGARMVLDLAKTLSPKPIRWVINTHHHPDHSYGNHLFTQEGATTIAHIGDYEEMQRYEPRTWQSVSRMRKDVAALNMPVPDPPMLLYTGNLYVITDGVRRVELHHFAFGHTRGDTFVYLPKEKVLCTGDAVVNGPYGDPKNAYMGNWPQEVKLAQELGAEYVLPGHGDNGGKELLEGQIRFFEALYKAVEAEFKSGKTLEQLVTMKRRRTGYCHHRPASAEHHGRLCLQTESDAAGLRRCQVPHAGDGYLRGDQERETLRRRCVGLGKSVPVDSVLRFEYGLPPSGRTRGVSGDVVRGYGSGIRARRDCRTEYARLRSRQDAGQTSRPVWPA
jgi:cyclase